MKQMHFCTTALKLKKEKNLFDFMTYDHKYNITKDFVLQTLLTCPMHHSAGGPQSRVPWATHGLLCSGADGRARNGETRETREWEHSTRSVCKTPNFSAFLLSLSPRTQRSGPEGPSHQDEAPRTGFSQAKAQPTLTLAMANFSCIFLGLSCKATSWR